MTNAGTRILNALARMFYGVRVLCGCGLALFFLAAANGPAKAQIGASGAGGSYITPFPGGERYKLRVIGDEFGEGIHSALVESLGSDPRLDIEKKPIWLSGLTRPNSVEELRDITRDVASEKPNIIVIMFGSMDRWSYRAPNGLRYSVGTAEWRPRGSSGRARHVPESGQGQGRGLLDETLVLAPRIPSNDNYV